MDDERKTPPPPPSDRRESSETTPPSPAYFPSSAHHNNNSSSPKNSSSSFRVDAPEFTPTKTAPFSPTLAPSRSPPNAQRRRASRAMESRLWRSDELAHELALCNHWLLYQNDASDPNLPALDLNGYDDILPFSGAGPYDVSLTLPSKTISADCSTFRARKSSSGKLFTVIIFADIEAEDNSIFASLDAYRRFQSAFSLRLVEAFTTHQNGRPELIVIYENQPGATKLAQVIKTLRPDEYLRHVPLWIAQLLCLFASAHHGGLAFDEVLRIENVLVTASREKILLAGLGIPELLQGAAAASANGARGRNTTRSLGDRQFKAKDYEGLRMIIDYILVPVPPRSDVALRIAKWTAELPPVWQYSLEQLQRVLTTCEIHDLVIASLNQRAGRLESELVKFLENDRLFRLMVKFCFINERQSYAHDQNWSETGDRYVLKLFRDFVFHSQDESGRPILDVTHVIDALNKLDAGSSEMLMLSSRKGDQCIFASYADIRERLDGSFEQLLGS